jgi:hypothetical protein
MHFTVTKQAGQENQRDTTSQVDGDDNYSTSKPRTILTSVITLIIFTQLQMG